jgi:hypothetical protein
MRAGDRQFHQHHTGRTEEEVMKHVMVRYTTRADRADENARLIVDVFESLRRTAPPGLTYASYRLDDGVSFVHIASLENPDNNPLRQLAAFQAFTAGVRDRCEVPPVTSALQEVGRYSDK